MPAKNCASTRFNGLDEDQRAERRSLGVSWTFSTGMGAGHEAAPLVGGSTMFIVTPFPNMVYAFDLSQASAPMRWQYDARQVIVPIDRRRPSQCRRSVSLARMRLAHSRRK